MEKIRVIMAKPGLDGHDRGAKVVSRALRDTILLTGYKHALQPRYRRAGFRLTK